MSEFVRDQRGEVVFIWTDHVGSISPLFRIGQGVFIVQSLIAKMTAMAISVVVIFVKI